MKALLASAALAGLLLAGVIDLAPSRPDLPRPFRVYPSYEPYDARDLPPDYREKTEWAQARLMYPTRAWTSPDIPFVTREPLLRDPGWLQGGTSWTQDYPRADRNFSAALRRLTSLHARSVEQPVNLDDGQDVYNWPWLVAGEMGDWDLTPHQAARLREYLLRGGFLYCDDFWGPEEWRWFMISMAMVFPDRPVVDIDDRDSVWRVLYSITDHSAIVGKWALDEGRTGRNHGDTPYWRGIYDDRGRLMVAISFNSDVGDSWEFADTPDYPERYADAGLRWGINLVLYDLTH